MYHASIMKTKQGEEWQVLPQDAGPYSKSRVRVGKHQEKN